MQTSANHANRNRKEGGLKETKMDGRMVHGWVYRWKNGRNAGWKKSWKTVLEKGRKDEGEK